MSDIWEDSDSDYSDLGECDNPWNAVDCLGSSHPLKFTDFEKKMKQKFTYDTQKYREFNDLRVYSIQSTHRYHNLRKLLKFPNIPPFNSVFCVFNRKYSGYRAERFLQRRVCLDRCNWDPSKCFLEDSHSGKFKDLMNQNFLDKYNPGFSSQFGQDKTNVELKVDKEKHPKIFELVVELGINSNFIYDKEGSAVTLDNLTDQFRNDERPLFILEEKKVNDIIIALLEASADDVEQHKVEMSKRFHDSFHYSGGESRPILSLMMWGPQNCNTFPIRSLSCSLEEDSWNRDVLNGNLHKCQNFDGKHHWMFGHDDDVVCNGAGLDGPGMKDNLALVYPCSKNICLVDCICSFCENTRRGLCKLNKHKKHMQQFDKDCLVQRQSQCQLHWVTHPENFEYEEDIVIEKNIFFHNDKLIEQPRNHVVDIIKFAGIKKDCLECRSNVHDHFRNHLDFHLQCKFCSFQLATLVDKDFWNRVCNICGKVFPSDAVKFLNWHKKVHNDTEEFKCNICKVNFKRKFTLRRHMKEEHGEPQMIDSVELNVLNHFDVTDDNDTAKKEETTKAEIFENETPPYFQCLECEKKFRFMRYLERHVDLMHKRTEKFKCIECDKEFQYKKDLKFHQLNVHFQNKSESYTFLQDENCKHSCNLCGKQFNRKDYLKRHQKTHEVSEPEFSCNLCEKKFGRQDTLNDHTQRVHVSERATYTCNICGQNFNIKSNMVRHKKRFNHM